MAPTPSPIRSSPPTSTRFQGDFFTTFLHRLHDETAKRNQRLIPFTTPDHHHAIGGQSGNDLSAHYNNGAPRPDVPPAFGFDLQHTQWADRDIVDALLILAPPPNAIADCEKIRSQTDLPVILWRKVGPLDPPEAWSQYQSESRDALTTLNGFNAHAMVYTNYRDYPDKVFNLLK
ncbi:MAG: hypothetical protein CMJ49_00540 [Planctomycetaceae bacterium]|nr:hypothetical protein [Planctomycetaceae bacterium]